VHRLADDVLAQHRADHREPVAAPRERCDSGPLEVNVADRPVLAGDLAEQQGASVTQTRDEAAELVSGVGLRDGRGPIGHQRADQKPQTVRAAQPRRIQT
jgi:hypothetical protein